MSIFEKDVDFINVEGSDLPTRLAAVAQLRKRAPGSPCRIAYTFPLRPNVAFDAVRINADGSRTSMGIITGADHATATRRAGLFLWYEAEGEGGQHRLARVEVYDLNRRHEYKGQASYWLGRVEATESLEFVRSLITQSCASEAAVNLTEAAALHDDPRAAVLLAELARRPNLPQVRLTAARWLGRIPGNLEILSEVVRDGSESAEVRAQAALSLGKSLESQAVSILCTLYETVEELPLKAQIITALSKHKESAAAQFLQTISESETDAGLRLHSVAKLEKVRGKKQKWKPSKPLFKGFKSESKVV
jgi:hypothetical protein